MTRALQWIVFVAVILLATASRASAEDVRRAGTVRLEAGGGRGPLALAPSKDGFSGELAIVNDGKEPLVVSRIVVRGDATDPRAPPKLTLRLVEGSLPATIPPGASRKAQVVWAPEKGLRVRQLFGHVIVTTSDEHSGEVAMGVTAQLPGPLGPLEGRVLSLIIGLPLVGAVAMFLARASRRGDHATPQRIAVTALAAQAALALYVYRTFAADVSRVDGNDGLQFVEHAVWIRSFAAEIFFGVDGTSVGPLLVASLVALLALLSERTVPRDAAGYHEAYLVLASAVAGALVAMDAILFVLFASIAIASAAVLVGGWGGPERRQAATRIALLGLVAVLLLVIASLSIARAADPTFLVDGTRTTITFSLPELSRVALGANGAKLFGAALPKSAFVLVLLAALFLLGSFPLHGWLLPTLVQARSAAGTLVVVALPALGGTALLRFGCSVLPEGMRWASGVVVALGAVTAAYGALAALGETDLRRIAAYATTSQVGFALLGIGSLTPQGIAGAMVLASTRALACATFLLVAGAIEDRVRTCDVARLSGAGTQMPGWAAALGVAALAHAGVLGFGGAWGPLLALFGALPNYAPLAVAAALALVVLAAAHLVAVARVLFGKVEPDWEKSPLLELYGGRFPDLTSREWTGIGPLAAVVVLLGVWPAPLVASTSGTVRDLTNAVSPPGPEQIASDKEARPPSSESGRG